MELSISYEIVDYYLNVGLTNSHEGLAISYVVEIILHVADNSCR